MLENISCPSCSRRLVLPPEIVGNHVQCPSCHTIFLATAAGVVPAVEWTPRQDQVRAQAEPWSSPPAEIPSVQWPEPIGIDRARSSPSGKSATRRSAVRWIVVGVGGLVAVIALIVLLVAMAHRREAEEGDRVLAEQRRQEEHRQREIMEAFRQQKQLAKDEIAQELKALFENLGNALRNRDARGVQASFDTDRMVEELISLNGIPNALRGQQGIIARQIEAGIGPAVLKNPFLQWNETEIRNIKKLEGNEAVVVIRHRAPDGAFMRMRWWVTKRPGTWKVFDFEDLDMAMRFSSIAASATQGGLARMKDVGRAMQDIGESMVALAGRDQDTAARKLRQAEGVNLPPKLEALRGYATGTLRLHENRLDEALREFDKAERNNSDMPGLDLARAMTYNRLGQWEKALKHVEKYRDLLGEDGQVCLELGDALRGLGRFPEAHAALGKALDFEPNNPDAFLLFLQTHDFEDDRSELGRRFAKLENPHAEFEICANDCKQVRDGKSMEVLSQAMKRIDPQHTSADYYLMLSKIWSGKLDEALPLFKASLAREKDASRRKAHTQEFLVSMANSGRVTQAYDVAPDSRAAFAILAPELLRSFRSDELVKLMALHGKRHADDPLLSWFEGAVLALNFEYEKAEKAFQTAQEKPAEQSVLNALRFSRVQARYHTAGAMAAYREFGREQNVFRDLAAWCVQDEKHEELEQLLVAQAKDDPDNPDLPPFALQHLVRQNKLGDALAYLKKELKRRPPVPGPDGRLPAVSPLEITYYFAMVDHGKAIQAYAASTNPDQAFQTLGSELAGQGKFAELTGLMDAHRMKRPNDPWIIYYVGQQHQVRGNWNEAAKSLAEWWQKTPPDKRLHLRWNVVYAMYKAGRGREAYAVMEPKQGTFRQLAELLVGDSNAPELEALVALHRPNAGDDADPLYYEAIARMLAKKPAEATPLFLKALEKQKAKYRQNDYVRKYARYAAEADQPVEAYQAVSEKLASLAPVAFESLAQELVFLKKPAPLEALIGEHAKKGADQPLDQYFRGELNLLKCDPQKACDEFSAALAKAQPTREWMFRNGLYRARIKAGKTAETYREFGADARILADLAALCTQDKNPKMLAEVLAEHRKAQPDDPNLPGWELDLLMLSTDYAGAYKLLSENRQGLFAQQRHRWKADNCLVRCLVKLKKYDEAIREGEEQIKKKRGNQVLVVLARACRGGAKEAIAALENYGAQPYLVEDCFRDSDLGPMLKSEGFQSFRARFPEPPLRHWDGGGGGDFDD